MADGAATVRGEFSRRVSAQFEADPASARAARALVSRACEAWDLACVVGDAELVVTELVENAVRHAGTGGTIVIEQVPGGLKSSVYDGSPNPPRLKQPGQTTIGGRGLLLIERLCRNWGFERVGAGKVVWAMLPIPPGPHVDHRTSQRENQTSHTHQTNLTRR